MRLLPNLPLVAVATALTVAALAQDTPPQNNIKARELFYASRRNTPAPQAGNRGTSAGTRSTNPGATPPARGAGANPTQGAGPSTSADASPLALRYKVLKLNGSSFQEVDTDTDFSSGNKIKVNLTINDTAYVYVAQLGSSGMWKVLFPKSDSAGGNIVGAYEDVQIPPADEAFEFDNRTGTEHLFIAVSKEPIANLQRAIQNRNTPDTPPPAPSEQKGRPNLVAANPITPQFSANLVDEVLRSRDLKLVAYKADTSSGASQEHAIYMASGADSKSPVVAEFKLKHLR